MTAPKIYRWDDDNAPVLSGQAGSAVNLLRACLADGYGAKQPAGWSMPYRNDAGSLAAFRNNPDAGTGFYLQVNNANNIVYAQGYENMTDEATGLFPFHNSNAMGFVSSASTNTVPRPWILFADDRFFMIVVWNACATADFVNAQDNVNVNIGYPHMFAFGDCIPLSASDSHFCVINGRIDDSSRGAFSFLASQAVVGSTTVLFAARNAAGIDAVTPCALIVGGGPLQTTDEGVNQVSNNFPPRTPGHEIVSRPYINDGTAYSMRGYAPGIWHACHKAVELRLLETFDVGPHRFMVIMSYGGSDAWRSHFLVDISEHWRP